jgi:hypothetical protein
MLKYAKGPVSFLYKDVKNKESGKTSGLNPTFGTLGFWRR